MPPGTGDVQLSVSQNIPISDASSPFEITIRLNGMQLHAVTIGILASTAFDIPDSQDLHRFSFGLLGWIKQLNSLGVLGEKEVRVVKMQPICVSKRLHLEQSPVVLSNSSTAAKAVTQSCTGDSVDTKSPQALWVWLIPLTK
ncbi:hypothetical protein IHE44_0013862 [Lamprotornis superbus]|uniref:Uncharacterized protein n=1 Tax=Lamprotornis superbus TaxID=245042 RepID=A0A835NV31_9PASS|nr:hypothetical protein IHE44_0013862 [Lamprotornis superbus]